MVRASASEAIGLDAVVADFPGWALIEVTGSHRERFLSSQVTSDLRSLAAGDSQLSALLDRSGRTQAYFYLRKNAQSIDLLVPEAVARHCVERLESHVIADDVAIRGRDVGPMRLLLGPAAVAMADAIGEDGCFPVAGWGGRGCVTWGAGECSFPKISPEELDNLSVLGGPPTWGREIQPDQLINETALLDSAVSFTKGCFLGQETVAKVASHRGALRAPVLLEIAAPLADMESRVGEWFSVGHRDRAGLVVVAGLVAGPILVAGIPPPGTQGHRARNRWCLRRWAIAGCSDPIPAGPASAEPGRDGGSAHRGGIGRVCRGPLRSRPRVARACDGHLSDLGRRL